MTDRIRGRRLQQIRRRHFEMAPLCVECERRGIIRQATQLDHTVALVNKGKDEDSNRQGLCEACHRDKTARDLGYRPRPVIGPDGFPIRDPEAAGNRGGAKP